MSKLAYIINLAEKGDASAQNELGISYMAGRHGLEEDEEKDFYWLEQAAAQGLLSAQLTLARCLESGSKLPLNLTRA